MKETIEPIPIEKIEPPIIIREYPDGDIEKLKNSMNNSSQLQNIVVRSNGNGGYQCISGWGRVLAAKRLHWKEILAKKIQVKENEVLILTLTENLCRKDLTTIEREKMIYQLHIENKDLSLRKLAEKLDGVITYEWVRKSIKAIEIRKEFGDNWEKVSSYLPTDIIFLMEKIPLELKQNIAEEIRNGSLKSDVQEVKLYINRFNSGTEEEKEKMLEGTNTTPEINDIVSKPTTFEKMFKEISKTDDYVVTKLDDVERKQAVVNLKHTTLKILNLLLIANEIREQDFQHITKILKVNLEEVKARLGEY